MKIGRGDFLLGDCFEHMANIPDGSVDMIITSPPYDDLRSYNDGEAWTWDSFVKIAPHLKRVLKPGGVIMWNVSDATVDGSETLTSFKQAIFFKEVLGLKIHDTMIWEKSTFSAVGSLKVRYAPVFEYVFIITKGKIGYFDPIKDRPNKHAGVSHHGTVRQKDGSTKPVAGLQSKKVVADFGQRFNVWRINEEKSANKNHPAVMPVALALDHIRSWCPMNGVVMDPFAGSGTTAIAAINSNRNWICIERDPDYYAKAVERVKKHVGA